ncbi:hypothetical protein CC86DRAFT_394516 [Ophiobolus disseminans]|uniref:Zn(2)-C6 fungal-type domain-containing protein n=1 Tax=Ophiobolus disseminans TaxID=1469910 RepID=A0A6A6ZXK4_9PLEO|nr:hypothetical protein CC86DRAFT_394516 [Ophiobolus disseminans]
MQQESPLSDNTSTLRDSPSEIAAPKITRKSHRKSRAGCKNCKTRRIKCDERKPHCANCKRRDVQCAYPTHNPVLDPESGEGLKSCEDLRLSEIELTYHWSTTTSQSLSAWSSGGVVWQSLFEDVALNHRHVIHLMFSLTALQLAHCRPSRRSQYIETADYHYERGLTGLTHDISNIGTENCDAILLSVQLICFVNWAKGPQVGEYLAFGNHGRSDWLVMFRGIRSTLESFGSENFSKTHTPAVKSKGRPLPTLSEPAGYQLHLSELRDHVAVTSQPADSPKNVKAVDVLKECYDSRYGGIDTEYHVVFAWLYRMDDDFLDRLQGRDAIPLIIFAHFVVLMQEMETFWYMKGWTHHVMSGIFESLEREHTPWIRWPMAKVGWISP